VQGKGHIERRRKYDTVFKCRDKPGGSKGKIVRIQNSVFVFYQLRVRVVLGFTKKQEGNMGFFK
jgi:hypothetical protein